MESEHQDSLACTGRSLAPLGMTDYSIPAARCSHRTYAMIRCTAASATPGTGGMFPKRQWWAGTPSATARWKAMSA